MNESAVVVRHQTGTVTVEGGDVVVRLSGTRGVLRKQPWSEEIRVPVGRASVKIAGSDLSIYQDGKIERMVLGCGPADQLARLAELLPVHDPGTVPATPEVQVKTYRSAKEYERDAPVMAADGWLPHGQTSQQGGVAVGRTAAKAVLTGGIGLAVTGRSRKDDTITVTWVRNG